MSDTEQSTISEIHDETLVTRQEAIDEKRRINCEAIARQYLEPIYKDHYIEFERDTAANKILKLMTQILMDQAQEHANTEYYRGIVVKIGELFGKEAYTSDDGSVQDGVLCAKVFELVEKSLQKDTSDQDAHNKSFLEYLNAVTKLSDLNVELTKRVKYLEDENRNLIANKNQFPNSLMNPALKFLEYTNILTSGLSFKLALMDQFGLTTPNEVEFNSFLTTVNGILRKYDHVKNFINNQPTTSFSPDYKPEPSHTPNVPPNPYMSGNFPIGIDKNGNPIYHHPNLFFHKTVVKP